MKKKLIIICSVAIIAILAIIFIIVPNLHKDQTSFMSYSEVIENIQKKEITEITIYTTTTVADVKTKGGSMYKTRLPAKDAFLEFVTNQVKDGNPLKLNIEEPKEEPEIIKNLKAILLATFLSIARIILIIWCISLIAKKIKNRTDSGDILDFDLFGSSNFAKEAHSDVKFSDVAGIDEEKGQCLEIIEFLKNGKKYAEIGAKIPKGILLSGEPGTGKTLLAKAIAGEAGVPFYSTNGSEFEEKFVGVGASRVRSLFKKARQNAPCIIFIDEIDAVAGERYDEKNYSEQTLNMLLSEMDGFKGSEGVIVIAATNHEEVLDSAILRPGRFDRKIYIPLPDAYARLEILKTHSNGKKISANIHLEETAKKTTGFSGAELENLLNEAAIIAVSRKSKEIEECDLDEAYARITIGLEKRKRPISQKEKYQTAIHESGHAVIKHILCPNIETMGISIIPRGKAGGYNLFNEEEKMYLSKEDAFARMTIAYGGRAAEKLLLNIVSSGPEEDLKMASKIANISVTKYAMTDKLVTCIEISEFDDKVLENDSGDIEKLCQDAYENAESIIEKNKSLVLNLANELMNKETLTPEEINNILNCS